MLLKEAYTFDNINNENDGPSNVTATDKFIVKNGVAAIDEGPNEPTDIKDGKKVIAYTDPISQGEKSFTSEGYAGTQSGMLVDNKHTNEQKVAASPTSIISITKSDFTSAVGDKKLNTAVFVIVNPENKAFIKQLQDLQKQGTGNVQVIKDTNQKVNTFNITVVGVNK